MRLKKIQRWFIKQWKNITLPVIISAGWIFYSHYHDETDKPPISATESSIVANGNISANASGGGLAIVGTVSGGVSVGIPLNQHEEILKKKEQEIRTEIAVRTALHPKYPGIRSYHGDAQIAMAQDLGGKLIIHAPAETILQPFGPEVPIWFSIKTNGLFISAAFHDHEGKLLAELHDNTLTANANNTFQTLQNYSSIEVLDQYGTPVLQLEYINDDTYKFCGVIRGDNSDTGNRYTSFPKRTVDYFLLGGMKGSVSLIAENTMLANITISDPKQFAEKANEVIPRWFKNGQNTHTHEERFEIPQYLRRQQ